MVTQSNDPNARSPAKAYFQMEAILPPSYFLEHPPSTGMHVVVQGTDIVLCAFPMSALLFDKVKPTILANPELRLVSAKRYKDNGDVKGS